MPGNKTQSAVAGLLQELFAYSGWLDRSFGHIGGDRLISWRAALSIFIARGGSVIVETGCQRHPTDKGDGSSTALLTSVLKRLDRGILHSVDISADNIAVAKAAIYHVGGADENKFALFDRVRFHLSDSVEFLRTFNGTIDLLYLDSEDWHEEESRLLSCQAHQLEEIQSSIEKLSPGAVVLLDDNDAPGGGKTRLSKSFLAEQGWLCLLDWKQSLWVRSV